MEPKGSALSFVSFVFLLCWQKLVVSCVFYIVWGIVVVAVGKLLLRMLVRKKRRFFQIQVGMYQEESSFYLWRIIKL